MGVVDTSSPIHYERKMFKPFLAIALLIALFSSTLLAAETKTFKVGDFTFTRPEAWEWMPVTSSMRKAQLKVIGPKDDNAEVVFFHFGEGNGGGTKANVDRWLGQFQDKTTPKVEETKIGTHKVTYVQVEGTYMSGMPGGRLTPQPKSMLNGAIIESDSGNVFIKMTGPIALMKSSSDTFKKMVEGPLK